MTPEEVLATTRPGGGGVGPNRRRADPQAPLRHAPRHAPLHATALGWPLLALLSLQSQGLEDPFSTLLGIGALVTFAVFCWTIIKMERVLNADGESLFYPWKVRNPRQHARRIDGVLSTSIRRLRSGEDEEEVLATLHLHVDGQLRRRSDLAWVEPAMNDRNVHITWTRSDPGHNQWSIVYTKYTMTGELPLIPEKDILTEDQYFEGSWVDPMGPEMSMDPENGIYISFSGRTLGPKANYASMFCKRFFYVHLDNNGEVKTTISRISRQDLRAAWPGGNPMDIDHYGGDVNVNGWYYTVHDLWVTNQGQYHGDIEMRYFKGMSGTYTHT